MFERRNGIGDVTGRLAAARSETGQAGPENLANGKVGREPLADQPLDAQHRLVTLGAQGRGESAINPAAAELLPGSKVRTVRPPTGGPAARRIRQFLDRWLPAGLSVVRAWPRRWLTFGAVAVLGIVLVCSIALLGGPAAPERPPPLPAAQAAAQPPPPPPPSGNIVVSVVGKVDRPGLVTVPVGARVADALRAAGGPLSETDGAAVNLARRLVDGEQLYVGISGPTLEPQSGPVAAQSNTPETGQPSGAGKVSLNRATVQQLDALPGVGAVTAKRIIDWRNQHGGFASVEQLREVDGIGDGRFQRLRELVSVP